MENKDLTLTYWLVNGWQVYRKNLKEILAITVVLFIYLWLLVPVTRLPHGSLIVNTVSFIVGPALMGGYHFFCLMLVREKNANGSHFTDGFSNFWKVWLASFFRYLVSAIGLCLFIVPGIIWSIKYSFSVIIVLDKKLSPLQAVKYSGHITYGHKGKLFVLLVLSFVIAITFGITMFRLHGHVNTPQDQPMRFIFLGVIPSLFYHFVVLPWSFLAFITAYNTLREQYEKANM